VCERDRKFVQGEGLECETLRGQDKVEYVLEENQKRKVNIESFGSKAIHKCGWWWKIERERPKHA
jgi:hypothetical protein